MATKKELQEEIAKLKTEQIKASETIITLGAALSDCQQENAAHIAENHRLGLLLTQRLFKRVVIRY